MCWENIETEKKKTKKKRGLRHQESTVHIVILLPKGPRQFGYMI